MARKPRAIVLDSWSVIAYFEAEPAGPKVAELIAYAHDENIPVMMSVVNVGEVWYILARRDSESDADKGIKDLNNLQIEFVEADWELTKEAARLKSKHKMSYADCFAAALAIAKKADLVTGDNEFKQIGNEINVHWL